MVFLSFNFDSFSDSEDKTFCLFSDQYCFIDVVLYMLIFSSGSILNGNCEEELPKKPVGRLSVNCRPTGYRQVKKKEKLRNLQSKTLPKTLKTISYVSIQTLLFKSPYNATRPLEVCHLCINDVYLVHLCS